MEGRLLETNQRRMLLIDKVVDEPLALGISQWIKAFALIVRMVLRIAFCEKPRRHSALRSCPDGNRDSGYAERFGGLTQTRSSCQ